jgi:hypothetical protein
MFAIKTNMLYCFNFTDYIVTAEVSLVPTSKSLTADTYKFTSVCNASFNAVYDESEMQKYSNAYAAATIVVIGLLCSAYFVGGKTRRLCTGKSDEESEIGSNFVEMNKIDEETDGNEIESELSIFPADVQAETENRNTKNPFPIFFRRQAKEKKSKRGRCVINSVDSAVA